MTVRFRLLLIFFVIFCIPGLVSCSESRRKATQPTSTPLSEAWTLGELEKDLKLGFHGTKSVGDLEYVVLLADFPDIERSIDPETISERMIWFLGEYFNQASYDKLVFEGTMVGPYTLPESVEEYKISPINQEVDRSRVLKLVNDVINLADDDVAFSEDLYVMIALGAPPTKYGMVGYCAVPGMLAFASNQPLTTKSGEVVANAVVFCENAHLGTYIHDTLHMIGGVVEGQRVTPCLYDHELQAKYIGGEDMPKIVVNMGYWDPLSSHFPFDKNLPPAGLSSWTKLRLGWIDPEQIALVYPGRTATLQLDPLVGGPQETLVIKIPLSEETYYLLENRQAVDSDQYLPADGVLILYADDRVHECLDGQAPVKIINASPDVPYFNDAAYDIGANEIFIDAENNVAIQLLSKNDLSYEILITTPDQITTVFSE